MSEQDEEEGGILEADPIPGYLVIKDELPMKEEARRAFILPFITDDAGVLLKNWEEEAMKIETYLKSGEVKAAKPNPMKVVK